MHFVFKSYVISQSLLLLTPLVLLFFSEPKFLVIFQFLFIKPEKGREREKKSKNQRILFLFSLTPRDLSNLEKQLFFFPENLSPSQKTFPHPDENSKDDYQPTNTRIVIPTTYIFLPKKNLFSIRCLHPERFVSLSEELIFNKLV